MKTLSKKITSSFYTTPDSFNSIKQVWRNRLANKEPLTATDHMIYAMLRGKDWTKGFTPVTNPNKLANGRKPNDTKKKLVFLLVYGRLGNHLDPYRHLVSESAFRDITMSFVTSDGYATKTLEVAS